MKQNCFDDYQWFNRPLGYKNLWYSVQAPTTVSLRCFHIFGVYLLFCFKYTQFELEPRAFQLSFQYLPSLPLNSAFLTRRAVNEDVFAGLWLGQTEFVW
jgi:hypothetical protein